MREDVDYVYDGCEIDDIQSRAMVAKLWTA